MSFIDSLREFMGVDKDNTPIPKKEDDLKSKSVDENVVKVSEYPTGSLKLDNKQLTYLKEIQTVFVKKNINQSFYEKHYGVSYNGLKDIISNRYYFERDKEFLNNLKKFHIEVVIPYQRQAEELSKEFDNIRL